MPTLIDVGKSRELAAMKAGLGSGRTFERARDVLATGVPALVQSLVP
jgi:hypothetical protein